MKKSLLVLAITVIAVSLTAPDVFGRGGGGGGRGGGGGGARGGGGGYGGVRPSASPSFNRSPSMSRSMPSQPMNRPMPSQRPSAGYGQGYSGNRPTQLPSANRPLPSTPSQRPSTGYGQGYSGNRPTQLPAMRPGTGGLSGLSSRERPSQGQLGDFLDMPADSSRRETASSLAYPSQLPSSRGSFGKTVTGPGGELAVGGVGGARTGPGGTTVGAGRVGMTYTGPGGNTYTKVAGGAAIRGPGGTTVAGGRGVAFANGQFVGGKSWSAVNGNFTRWNSFTPGWYGRYPGAWWPGKWAVAATAWNAANWTTAGEYCGCTGEGVYYDYGENVTYDHGIVYYGDQPVASANQYYSQADQLADSGQQPKNEEWLPLGVFAVISEPTQTKSDRVVQLALNKEGAIRGNLQDALTDKVMPIAGAVDKKSQRVAMKLEGNDSWVFETGLYDLTNDEVPVLVHFGTDLRETRTLIRLKQPEEQGQQQ